MTVELETELRKIGWYPGRRVDDDLVARWLRLCMQETGCHLFPLAVQMLREFGGLSVSDVQFGPDETIPNIEPPLNQEGVNEDHLCWLSYEWEVNEILFPIGYHLGGQYNLAISSTGKVFARGVGLSLEGSNFEEFLAMKALRRGGYTRIGPTEGSSVAFADIESIYPSIYERG